VSQPEAKLSTKIIRELRIRYPGSFWVKVHGGPTQRAGLPDIHGTVEGRSVWLETKLAGNKATELQLHTQKLLRDAGAIVAVVYSVDGALKAVELG